MKYNINKKLKENNGFTLIEALIVIVILALVSVLMVQGVSMARKAYSSNRTKTEASAIANQEIEKIRSMDFNDIGIISGDPAGTLEIQSVVNGFTITRSVIWVSGSNNKLKQVKIIISNPSLTNNVKLVTEISPIEMTIAAGTTTSSSTTTTVPATTTSSSTTTTVPATTTTTRVQYPAPSGLTITSDTWSSNKRTIVLQWNRPSNPPYGITITKYNVYRKLVNGTYSLIGTATPSNSTIGYSDVDFGNKDYNQYKYYVTTVYSNGTESPPSNEVTTIPV